MRVSDGPHWLKLERRGNVFTGYFSTDGEAWTPVGSATTVAMPGQVLIGYAVSPASANPLTGNFDSTRVLSNANGQPDFGLEVIPATQTVRSGGDRDYYSVRVTRLNGFTGAIGYGVSGLPAGASVGAVSGAATEVAILPLTSGAGVAAGTHALTVTGTSGSLSQSAPAALAVVSGAATTLPAPWADGSIGPVQTGTGAGLAGAVYSVTGAGCCLGGTTDNFHFAYQPVVGDVTLIGRVASRNGQGPGSKSGLFVRDFLTPRAGYGFAGYHELLRPMFQYRALEGVTAIHSSGSSSQLPVWFKLVRTGNTVTGFHSADGGVWTQTGTATVNLDAKVYVGLVSAPDAAGTTMTSTFDNLRVATSPDFFPLVLPATQTVNAATSATYTVHLNPVQGFNGAVTLAASGLPVGATATFSPNPATGGAASSTLTVAVGAGVAGGTYAFTITATSGGTTRTMEATLGVRSYTLTSNPMTRTVNRGTTTSYVITGTGDNGYTGSVAMTVSGLPSGVTASLTSPRGITVSGPFDGTMAITTNTSVAAGTYAITVTGVSSGITKTVVVELIVNTDPDFNILLSPATLQTVVERPAAGPATANRIIQGVNGFNGQVTVTASGYPSCISWTSGGNPQNVGGFGVNELVRSNNCGPADVVPGQSHTITWTGVSGSLTRTATSTLVLTDYTVSGTNATGARGGTATSTITVTAINGYYEGATFSVVSGLPANVTAAFNPTVRYGPGTSTLTFTIGANATPGTYNIVVQGRVYNPTPVRQTTIQLTVN